VTITRTRPVRPYAQRQTWTRSLRNRQVEQTAAIAVACGLWRKLPDDEMVAALRLAAPDQLAEVWDNPPGGGWLLRNLLASPIAWGRGAA
jgi:hypothetical protein